MMWRNIQTIWKREMKGYFYTPLAYVFIGVFSLLMGVMFFVPTNLYDLYSTFAVWYGSNGYN